MTTTATATTTATTTTLAIAPSQLIKGERALAASGSAIAALGKRPLIIGGNHSLAVVREQLTAIATQEDLTLTETVYTPDCCESSLGKLKNAIADHQADVVLGVGGGKSLDTAKIVAFQNQLPLVTIPTSGATCAGWTALGNIYSEAGAFQYDVPLPQCPNVMIVDYGLIASAPQRTLIAGIGDAIAKWYEASVSSGESEETLIIGAVQQARVLRDILLQKSAAALNHPGSKVWQEVVDATVIMAGVIGGIGGANCRTVAAHAIHNGLTHLPAAHGALHGEKVAYGILVQLRLEEMVNRHQLAATTRHQLLDFYQAIGLPQTLEDLGMGNITLKELELAAHISCDPQSDIHRLPLRLMPKKLWLP